MYDACNLDCFLYDIPQGGDENGWELEVARLGDFLLGVDWQTAGNCSSEPDFLHLCLTGSKTHGSLGNSVARWEVCLSIDRELYERRSCTWPAHH